MVREEQFGLLVNWFDMYKMEVLVINKIELDVVFWINFFKVDMNLVGKYIGFGSFYIVEEENMVVFFGGCKRMFRICIVGDNGFFFINLILLKFKKGLVYYKVYIRI